MRSGVTEGKGICATTDLGEGISEAYCTLNQGPASGRGGAVAVPEKAELYLYVGVACVGWKGRVSLHMQQAPG